VDDQAREDFRTYVVGRSPALLRTAYLLTGSRADAEDLLQTALDLPVLGPHATGKRWTVTSAGSW
jgi:hypothetical protein